MKAELEDFNINNGSVTLYYKDGGLEVIEEAVFIAFIESKYDLIGDTSYIGNNSPRLSEIGSPEWDVLQEGEAIEPKDFLEENYEKVINDFLAAR